MLRSDQGHVRLGREYLQVGRYTEPVFPSCDVDSLYESTDDFTPFRNIINEFYCKDCNNKGRSVMKLTGLDTSRPFAWSPTSVTNILDNETYQGVTVNMKMTISCKNKKTIYRNNSKTSCSVHGISEEDLYVIVLDDLRRVTHFARQNERKFAEYIGMKRTKEAKKEIRDLEKQISAMTKRQSELMSLFKRLYEDNVLGRISNEQYRILSAEYTLEQEIIKTALPELNGHLQGLKDSTSNFDRFLENAHKYTEINDLTPELLHTFIKRIEIGERTKKYSRSAAQDIVIHYRDIGITDDMSQKLEDLLRQVAEMDGDVTYVQEPVWDTDS